MSKKDALKTVSEINNRRFYSLDTLRGLAIIIMITIHFMGFLSDYKSALGLTIWFIIETMGSLWRSIFTLLVGVNLIISEFHRKDKGIEDKAIWRHSFIRGLLVFLLGYVLNLLIWGAWGLNKLFRMDILQLIGLSLMITSTLNYTFHLLNLSNITSITIKFALAISLILISNLFLQLVDISNIYNTYVPNMPLSYSIVFIFTIFFIGDFPIFPWYAFVLIGCIVGESGIFFPIESEKTLSFHNLSIISLLFIMISFISIALGFNLYSYPASLSFCLLSIGIDIITLILLHKIQDINKKGIENFFSNFLLRISKTSLSIWAVHLAIISWAIIIIRFIFNISIYQTIRFDFVLIIIIVFQCLLFTFIKYWEKFDYKFGLEWILSKLNPY